MSPEERAEIFRRLEEEAEAAARRADELLRRVIGGHMAAHEEIIQPSQGSVASEVRTAIPAPKITKPITARSDAEAIFELLYSVAREPVPGWQPRRANAVLSAANGPGLGHCMNRERWGQRERIEAKFRREMRALGKTCTVCGEHYTPERINQARCPECIAARKQRRPA